VARDDEGVSHSAAGTVLRMAGRSALVGLTTAAVLFVLAAILPGFAIRGRFDGAGPALLAALVFVLVNAIVWPLVLRVALGVVVVTFGLGAFVLNALLVWGGLALVPGVHLGSLPVAVLVTVLASAASAAAASRLPLGRDAADLRALRQGERRSRSRLPVRVGRLRVGLVRVRAAAAPEVLGPRAVHLGHTGAQRSAARIEAAGRDVPGAVATPAPLAGPEVPGMVLLQIDGLSSAALLRAVAAGRMPFLERELQTRRLLLHRWDTGIASQTAASQCGLLFGDDDDIPAFRWLEKETGRVVVANRSEGAQAIEERHSDGRGLLYADGAVSGTLVSGDAGYAIVTMSVAGTRKGRIGTGYGGYFADPARAARTALSFVAEVVRELWAAALQRWRHVEPRVHRGGYYPLLRALTTIITRDVTVQSVVDHVLAGRSVVYTDLLGYDEVAHHSGIAAPDTLAVLHDLDRRIARIAAITRAVRRPYRLVVLSDHGQTPTRPFRDVFGLTLLDTVRLACGLPPVDKAARRRLAERRPAGAEASWSVSAALADRPEQLRPRTAARIVDADERRGEAEQSAPSDRVVVLASGGLGLVSLTEVAGRATRAEVDNRFPGLLPALRAHPGVGFVVVATAPGDECGPVVLGAAGSRRLAPVGSEHDVVEGVDPLLAYGGDAAAWSLRRACRFAHSPDVLIQAATDPATGEQFSFEDFAASHGALGGEQNDAFVLAPPDLPGPPAGEVLRGGVAVHQLLRSWLAALGHPAFAADRSRPRAGAFGNGPVADPDDDLDALAPHASRTPMPDLD
jgi:uncharacterized membrane protein YvlD (DUF360 family)